MAVETIELDELDLKTGDERVDRAKEIIKEAMVKFALLSKRKRDSRNRLGVSSVIEYRLASLAVWELVDEGIDTMCVELRGDGVIRLKCNIDFVISQGVDITMRGLTHEMNHIKHPVFMLKRDAEGGVEFLAEWMRDPLFVQYALEYWNNAQVMRAFGDKEMLDLGDKGEPIGLMNPDKAYQSYRKFKKDVGEDPVSREQFLLTPEVCYGYLKEMPKPPRQKHQGGCSHGQGGGVGEDSDESSPGSSGIDPTEATEIMDQIFDHLMSRALDGDEQARDALLDAGEQLGGEGSKFWSDMGLGRLIGKEIPSIKVRFWETFLTNAMGSRLVDGLAMQYPRKEAGLQPFYEMMDSSIPLKPMGKEHEKIVWGFIDTSGSMPQELVDRCVALAGQIEGCETKWHTFSTDVYVCEDPTKIVYDRGGTSFEAIDRYVTTQDDLPDCVLIITDGYAPHITPTWADEAVWVITDGGDMWPEQYGMTAVLTDIPANAA